ncbi:hypothetical protein LOK49_LG02G02950 [Camellia lanceoleosa]|uniref:Uncharacterized protein n=1 Tax=Camellia lanceoleosa TaxID=1840588 RepID=A0ACC0IMZ5_9ERIC|nr:hypothetical protein LOK49_LG02G02950 [Camellia lanceoleosa]
MSCSSASKVCRMIAEALEASSISPLRKFTQEATSTSSPKHHIGDAKFFTSLESEGHDTVQHNTCHRRHIRVVKFVEKLAEWDWTVLFGGLTQQNVLLGGVISSIGWEAIGDGFKGEVRQANKRSGASGLEQAFVVVLSVDKGYVEAFGVKKL